MRFAFILSEVLINLADGWMTCDFTSFLTVFRSYQDDGLVDNERLCAMELRLRLRRFHFE